MSNTKILSIVFASLFTLLLAMVALLFLMIKTINQPKLPDSKLADQSMSIIAHLELEDLNGKTVELPGKGRYRILNYWASWCGPCIDELPILNKYAASTDKDMPLMIGIALDDSQAISEFLAKNPSTYSHYIEIYKNTDSSTALGNTQGTIPYTILISPDGRLLKQSHGTFADIDALKAFASVPN
jgi:thiol-disulfide isomerase/thioredoxin